MISNYLCNKCHPKFFIENYFLLNMLPQLIYIFSIEALLLSIGLLIYLSAFYLSKLFDSQDHTYVFLSFYLQHLVQYMNTVVA